MIKKWPKGVDRWRSRDIYVKQIGHPDFSSFEEYTSKKLTGNFRGIFPDLENRTDNIPELGIEDKQLVCDIEGLTLKQFVKEAFLKKTRKEQHTLLLYILLSMGIGLVNLAMYFAWDQIPNIREVDLTPEAYYEYPLAMAEHELTELGGRIRNTTEEYKVLLEKVRDSHTV